jgi:hypothetical protein
VGPVLSSSNALFNRVQHLNRIQRLLDSKLSDSGWLDNLKHQGKGKNGQLNVELCLKNFIEKAKGMVPISVHVLIEELMQQVQCKCDVLDGNTDIDILQHLYHWRSERM